MDTHARLIAYALQIALAAAIVLVSLCLSPTAATAFSPGYPVDAVIFGLRAMLCGLARALRQRG